MRTVLLWVARLGGIFGVLLCAMALALRLRGVYNFAGFQTGTLLQAGVAVMLVGCLGYLAVMVERPRE